MAGTPNPDSHESRMASRRRTRLRPVKLVTVAGRFIEDGTAIDVSETGCRIRRFGTGRVPARLAVYDEADNSFRLALVIWSRGPEIGVRFVGTPRAGTRADVHRLTGRFYAVTG
ncbi:MULTISPECIES: hypothetical protein [Aurantimonas]|uniref:hypothetical protein n=1 Tax=Aurantimonas TaxID=182269 RepID=UPI003518F18F